MVFVGDRLSARDACAFPSRAMKNAFNREKNGEL
jgi:hypothetical protein